MGEIYLQDEERMPGFQRRILIVEDDVFMGSLMVDALSNKGFIAQLAESAVAAKRRVMSFDPDIVLVDIDLGDGPNGIDFIQVVRKTRPEIAAILLSKHAKSSPGANYAPARALRRADRALG